MVMLSCGEGVINMDPDQTERSSLIRVHSVCFHNKIRSYSEKLRRPIFMINLVSMILFLFSDSLNGATEESENFIPKVSLFEIHHNFFS